MRRLLGVLGLWMALAVSAAAQDSASREAAWDAAIKVARQGPTAIEFTDQAALQVPGGMAFIPLPQANDLMKAWGNSTGDTFRGILLSTGSDEGWVIFIDQVAEGYVKDDDARNWNADDLLQSLKEGTEAQNEERVKMGIPAMDVVGWVQPPSYDSSTHRLVWSLKATDRGAPADADATVNYNTYALGRDGYFEINLATNFSKIEQDKPIVHNILKAFTYKDGKRYEDFNAETDHIAEYGIAALIAGVAAKKLGLLAVVGVFFLKFAKIILVAAAVAGGAIVKFFRRGSSEA